MKIINKYRGTTTLRKCKFGDVVNFPDGFYGMGAIDTPYLVGTKPINIDDSIPMREIINLRSGWVTRVANYFNVQVLNAELVIKGTIG